MYRRSKILSFVDWKMIQNEVTLCLKQSCFPFELSLFDKYLFLFSVKTHLIFTHFSEKQGNFVPQVNVS